MREALKMQLLSAVENLSWHLMAGSADLDDTWERIDLARALLHEVDAADDDVELAYLGRKRGVALIEALRGQLVIKRDLADTHDEAQRERHSADAAMIERLLSEMQS